MLFLTSKHQSVRELAKNLIVRYLLVNGCLRCRMIFGGQFLRQLPHGLMFFKTAFAKTFSSPGSVPSSYRDQLSFGGIHLCGDKTAIFLTLLIEAENCFETSPNFIPVLKETAHLPNRWFYLIAVL